MEAYFVRQNRKLPAYAKGLLLLMLLLKPFPGWAQALPTVVVQPHPVDLTLPVAATVEAIAQTTLTSQVSGRVMEMRVDVGQTVRKGELLLRIDAR